MPQKIWKFGLTFFGPKKGGGGNQKGSCWFLRYFYLSLASLMYKGDDTLWFDQVGLKLSCLGLILRSAVDVAGNISLEITPVTRATNTWW